MIAQPRKPRELAPCGTVAAYQRHLYHGESPCLPCREATKAASSARWGTSPENRAQRRRYTAARARAMTRLAARFPDQMAALLAEELGSDDIVKRKPSKWRTA